MRALVILIAAGLIALPGLSWAEKCKSGGYPIVLPGDYQHDRWVKGQEPEDIRIAYGGFTAVFDGPDDDDNNPDTLNFLAVPEWVANEVHRFEKDGKFVYATGYERPNPWYELTETDFLDRQPGVTEGRMDKSYAGEGAIWNRGHMATRNLVNRISAEAGCNTHNFANAVPQFWSLNQGEWLALENYTGALANKYGKAWAISGPIYYPGRPIETIGGEGEIKVSIPQALFKVIVFLIDDEIYVRAFVFQQPNYAEVKAIMSANGGKVPSMGYRLCQGTKQDSYDFTPYVSSLAEIESLTGITFFPDETDDIKATLNNYSSRGLWRVEAAFFEKPCGKQD